MRAIIITVPERQVQKRDWRIRPKVYEMLCGGRSLLEYAGLLYWGGNNKIDATDDNRIFQVLWAKAKNRRPKKIEIKGSPEVKGEKFIPKKRLTWFFLQI